MVEVKKHLNNKAKWLIILLSGLLVGAGANALLYQYPIQNNGKIATVGVTVTDVNGNPVTSLDWGAVESGTAYVWEPLNVTNISNVNATLNLYVQNIVGAVTIQLSWNYAGAVLQPNEWILVDLTQTVTGAPGTEWSYTTVIEAKSVE